MHLVIIWLQKYKNYYFVKIHRNKKYVLNVKRKTEFENEKLTAGVVPSLTEQELGDLDFAVLADLAGNSDVDAIRQAFNI